MNKAWPQDFDIALTIVKAREFELLNDRERIRETSETPRRAGRMGAKYRFQHASQQAAEQFLKTI